MKTLVRILALLPFLLSAALAMGQTETEVKALADKAAKLLTEKGDEALAVISKTNGDFHKGELYAFVYDENVKMLAHPEKPDLVGQSFKGKPDLKGKKFRDEIVAKGLSGGGWTEYEYQKPGATGIHKKKVLSKLATHKGKKYIVAVGMYAN
jgi:signal transduction histidine kinase